MTSLWMPVLMACAMLMTSVESRSLRQTHILQQLLKQLRNEDGIKQGTTLSIQRQFSDFLSVPFLPENQPVVLGNQPPVFLDFSTVPFLPGNLGLSIKNQEKAGDAPDFTHDLTHGLPEAKQNPGPTLSPFLDIEYDESRTRQSFFQRIQKNADDETELQINMCYVCDPRCASDISDAGYEYTNAYFDSLSAAMERDLDTMAGFTFHINTYYVLQWNREVEGESYLNTAAETDIAMLASVNDGFWTENHQYGNLWQGALAVGCDAGFLAITESDDIWNNNYCADIDGIANTFQICNSRSFATVRLEMNMATMSTLCAHELGHLCGLYHDGGIDEGYTDADEGFLNWLTTNSVTEPLYQNIQNDCQIGNEHCPDGQYNCIMSASVATQTSFSACSAAYLNMFLGLASEMSGTMYEDGCLPEKRSVDL